MTPKELEQAQKEAEAHNNNIRHVFGQDATGSKVYEYMREMFHDVSSFNSDPLKMAYSEGQRSVFLLLQTIVEGNENG